MTDFLTLVFEYIGNGLFNTYVEEIPALRIEGTTMRQGREMIELLLPTGSSQIREVKLIYPKRFRGGIE